MQSQRIFSLAAAAAFAMPALAQTAQAPRVARVTLDQAIAYAAANNPDLGAANAAVDSARGDRRVVGALPAPTLASVPNNPFQYSATIPLDVSPQRFLRVNAAGLGVSASRADAADVRRMMEVGVARAFYDVLLARDRRETAGQRRAALGRVLAADSVRVREGDLAEHNLARSSVEFARADAAVARADVDLENARLSLQTIIGAAASDSGVDAVGTLDYRRVEIPPDSVAILAAHKRSDLVAASVRVEQSAAARRLAAASVIPIPLISYVRQPAASFDNGHHYALGVGLELPAMGQVAGAKQRATAGLDAARWHERAVSLEVERGVRSALAELRIQRALVEKYQNGLLDRIAESVAAAQYAYDHGASSLLDVIDAIRAQQDARDDFAQALHDYWVGIHALNGAAGSSIVTP